MEGLKEFLRQYKFLQDADVLKDTVKGNFSKFKVYPHSINLKNSTLFFMAIVRGVKSLIIKGEGHLFESFTGDIEKIEGIQVKLCPLSNDNCKILQKTFDFTRPVNYKERSISTGLGDRLGMASPGHIRLIKDMDVFPVLAQQSIRELNLTKRTYIDVLSAASWAVFQEGYTSGFGADGDHLKTTEEVRMALNCGFTMITLDCSEHIDNKAASISDNEVEAAYGLLPFAERQLLEQKYLNKTIKLKSGNEVFLSEKEFRRVVLIYNKAVKYTIDIYNSIIKNCGREIDFEMSIDETLTSTTPASHYFVAAELISAGLEIRNLAPRFCGEFQKGIDYKGDREQFEKEFRLHFEIANHFGYKISVHSGSDKFDIFPIVGAVTGGKYHLKTAGTNWLEAVRVIARKNPSLYRRMHAFAIEKLQEAKKYYHIYTTAEMVPLIESMPDDQLPGLMDNDEARQALHITYGLILTAVDFTGKAVFRDEFFNTLVENEEEYYKALQDHIGRHLKELGIKRRIQA